MKYLTFFKENLIGQVAMRERRVLIKFHQDWVVKL